MGSPEANVITAAEAVEAETQNVFEARIDLTKKAQENDRQASMMLAFAQAYDVVDSSAVCQAACDELGAIKKKISALNAERMEETKLLDRLKQLIMNRYRPAISLLEQARDYLQPRIQRFLDAEETRRKAEERRLAELQRQERERIEAEAAERRRKAAADAEVERKKAAEIQAKADAEAREQDRQAEELRRQGDAQAAREADEHAQALREQAARDASAAAERAEQIKETGHAEAEQLQMSAVVAPAPIVASTKIAGAGRVSRWAAEIDLASGGIVDLAAHVAAHPEDANLLQVNQVAANALANARKEHFKVPGLRAVQKHTIANRSGRG